MGEIERPKVIIVGAGLVCTPSVKKGDINV